MDVLQRQKLLIENISQNQELSRERVSLWSAGSMAVTDMSYSLPTSMAGVSAGVSTPSAAAVVGAEGIKPIISEDNPSSVIGPSSSTNIPLFRILSILPLIFWPTV